MTHLENAVDRENEERVEEGLDADGQDELGPDVRDGSQQPLDHPAGEDEDDEGEDDPEGSEENHRDLLLRLQQGVLVVEADRVRVEGKPAREG